jgi:siroheme synthase-like protein
MTAEAPPAPLPIALCLLGRRVVVVGGGPESADKIPKLLGAGARVEVVAETVPASVAEASRTRRLLWWARALCEFDLHAADLVLLVDDDPILARKLRGLKGCYGYMFAAVDQPDVSDFYFVSIVTRGPIQIGISTGGRAPLLARTLRKAFEAGLDARFTAFAEQVVALRQQYRALAKPARIAALSRAFSGFALELRLRYPGETPENVQPDADPRTR